jgi:predicted nucleic acid-binding protein
MYPSFVIDASVVISWYNPDEQNDYAKNVLLCLQKERAITPCLCYYEVNNVLRMLEKKGKVSGIYVDKAITATDNLPIIRDYALVGFKMPIALRLSREHGLTVYDACYLELAVRLSLPLASLDDDLIKAAKAAKVTLR